MLPDWTVEDSDALDLRIIRGRLRTWGMNPDDAEVIALHSSGHNAADIALTTGRTLSCVQQAWHRYVSQREETIPLRDSRPVKRCAWCADTFRAEHNQRFCAPACQRLHQNALTQEHRRARGVSERYQDLECQMCGETFTGRHDRKFCSSECGRRAGSYAKGTRPRRTRCGKGHQYSGLLSSAGRQRCLPCERDRGERARTRRNGR